MQLSANSLPLPSSFKYYISISLAISIFLTEITAGQKSFQLLCPTHVDNTVMSILWTNVDFHPGFCKALRQKPWKVKEIPFHKPGQPFGDLLRTQVQTQNNHIFIQIIYFCIQQESRQTHLLFWLTYKFLIATGNTQLKMAFQGDSNFRNNNKFYLPYQS